MTAVSSDRDAWTNRFQTPTWDALVSVYAKPAAPLMQQARERLDAIAGLSPTLAWHGPSWRWSLRYDGHGRSGWAYLVPRPERPQLAVPLETDRLDALKVRKLSKPVRDTIELAPVVAGVAWCEWDLSSKAQVDELAALVAARVALGGGTG